MHEAKGVSSFEFQVSSLKHQPWHMSLASQLETRNLKLETFSLMTAREKGVSGFKFQVQAAVWAFHLLAPNSKLET
jgi:hypothetical protein